MNIVNFNSVLSANEYIYENMTQEQKDEYDKMIQTLPIIQDKLNRDKHSYKEDFDKILIIFRSLFNTVLFTPNKNIRGFKEILLFFAHISNLFPNELNFIPQSLIKLLQENYLTIPHEMRLAMTDAISLLRKKEIISPLEMHPLFFNLLRCQDKILRKKLCDCIISDLTQINQTHKNKQVNRSIQTYCEKILNDSNKKLARKTLNIMINLYQKKIWNDSRTVNAIASCINVKDEKMYIAACQFFLSEYQVDQVETSSEEELDELKNKYKLLGKANTKKTKTRKNKLKQLMKAIERKERRHSKIKVNKDFMPIDLLNDPLSFCQELFKKANNKTVSFSTKKVLIRLLGRVLGRHRLVLDNYFNFMMNFISLNQQDIGIILASIAEACHDQVIPVDLEPLIDKIFDVFISENNRPLPLTIGLNTLKEIIERCPYCIDKNQFLQIQNLKEFKHKSVSNAARAIVNLCKEIDGKFGKGSGEIAFGLSKVDDTIEGIELLKRLEKKPKEYKMEYEEILDDKQLKKLKALKLKYNAEMIQHKKTGITDKDINEMVGEKNEDEDEIDKGNEADEEFEEDEDGEEGEGEDEIEDEELEMIEDEELDEEEDDNEELEEIEDNEEMEEDNDISLSEHSNEEIELDSDEIDNSDDDNEDEENPHGFVDPEVLEYIHKTRAEKKEALKNQEKVQFKVTRKQKSGGKTNKEKLKNKPLMMVLPSKRLKSKIKATEKLQSMNKKIKKMKQQLGRFKRGNMVLKKKGGLLGKKSKRK